MTCRAVIGLQWGDEGKGKVVDLLASRADLVVRFQGGANAGHTVVRDGRKLVTHLVPSGAFHPRATCILGAGVVLDPDQLMAEVEEIRAAGIDLSDRLVVSCRAHVVFDYHKALDRLRETDLGEGRIGTTGRGIGPCYADKVNRCGLRVADLFDEAVLESRLVANVERANALLAAAGAEVFDPAALVAETRRRAAALEPYVADAEDRTAVALRAGQDVLFEGAQGTLLDLDFGTYPYVTSSNAAAGGLPLPRVDQCLGVTKAYTTRVGEGPFPTEMIGPEGERLREVGSEFGATTGRPRRCGWLDGVALRYAVRVGGVDALAVMKLDCLSGVDPLRIATGYEGLGATFPARLCDLQAARPIYEDLPGFDGDLTTARRLDDLPAAARRYLDRVAEVAEVPLAIVSVGPDREQTIEID